MMTSEGNHMAIRAIFFDLDDTIGHREASAYDCYARIIRDNSSIDDPFEFEAVVQDCMLWDEKGNINKDHIKDMLKKTYGIELPYEDLNVYWDQILWEHYVPYDDAAYTLEQLSGKYMLALLSNGPSDGQRNKLRQCGLDKYFDPERIIVSGDYGIKKPDPRIFIIACEKLGVKPEEAVYVGDIYARDVLGAHRAGLTPVWIWNWGERKCGTDTIVIHKISDLLQYF